MMNAMKKMAVGGAAALTVATAAGAVATPAKAAEVFTTVYWTGLNSTRTGVTMDANNAFYIGFNSPVDTFTDWGLGAYNPGTEAATISAAICNIVGGNTDICKPLGSSTIGAHTFDYASQENLNVAINFGGAYALRFISDKAVIVSNAGNNSNGIAFTGSGAADTNNITRGDYKPSTWAYGERNAVPEPATWALMIAGFGLAGAALRRNRATGQKLNTPKA